MESPMAAYAAVLLYAIPILFLWPPSIIFQTVEWFASPQLADWVNTYLLLSVGITAWSVKKEFSSP